MSKGQKAMTLRQRLRADANVKLGEIEQLVADAVGKAVGKAGVELNPYDVMRLCLGGRTKSIRDKLVRELANQAEAELQRIYNDQMNLLPGDGE